MVGKTLDEGSAPSPGKNGTGGFTFANVLALLALLVSLASVALSVWVNAQENDRQREDLAVQVIFVRVQGGPDFNVEPGQKPAVGESFYTVANFGRFPLEDVVVEAELAPGPLLMLVNKPAGTDPRAVAAVRLGTVGPCESASVPQHGEGGDYTRAVFTDVNGLRWSKEAASRPSDELPAPGFERYYPDLRNPQAWVERTRLESCR